MADLNWKPKQSDLATIVESAWQWELRQARLPVARGISND